MQLFGGQRMKNIDLRVSGIFLLLFAAHRKPPSENSLEKVIAFSISFYCIHSENKYISTKSRV